MAITSFGANPILVPGPASRCTISEEERFRRASQGEEMSKYRVLYDPFGNPQLVGPDPEKVLHNEISIRKELQNDIKLWLSDVKINIFKSGRPCGGVNL